MFDTALTFNDLLFMLKGAGVTLSVTAFAVVGGTLLGLFFGVLRSQISPWAALPLTFVLDIFRSVPLLIQLGDFPLRDLLHRAGALYLGLLHRDRARRD